MPDIKIQITNLPQIRAAFSRAPELMKISLTRAIPLVLKAIKDDEENQYANLGIGVRTGRLLLSIRTGLNYRAGTLYGEVGPNTSSYPGYDVTSTGGHYAQYIHNGTKFMQAKPFLKNAVQDAQPEIDRLFQVAVQDVLNNIGKMV